MTTPSVDAFLATPAAKKAAKKLAALAKKAQAAKAMQNAAQAEMDRMLREYMEANGVARDAEKWRPAPSPVGWLQNERPAPAKEPAFFMKAEGPAPSDAASGDVARERDLRVLRNARRERASARGPAGNWQVVVGSNHFRPDLESGAPPEAPST